MATNRLSELLRSPSLTSHWLGRIALRTLAGVGQADLFDRAMAIAAQLFTSVFPILIMISVWVGWSTSERLADAVSLPPTSQEVLEQALDESGGAAFGVLGTLLVLLSATSLSRALTRGMATIWRLPRQKTRLTNAWRWVAVVLTLALLAFLVRSLGRFLEPLPATNAWSLVITIGLDIALAAFVPWLLLEGQVPVRGLIPGGVVFALAMLVVRPASSAYLPGALEESADRYGSIGVAFTYLAWLYVVSFVFLAAAIIGNVIAEDRGRRDQLIRRGEPTRAGGPTGSGENTESTADP